MAAFLPTGLISMGYLVIKVTVRYADMQDMYYDRCSVSSPLAGPFAPFPL